MSRIWKTAKDIAAREHASALAVFADILWCYVRYGATRDDYLTHDFVRLRRRERANIVGYKKYLQLEKWFNDPATQRIVDNKRGFLKNYGEFLGRDRLIIDESTEAQIREFLSRHESVVQKQEDGKQGIGIRFLDCKKLLASPDAFAETVKAGGLLEERVTQHAEMAKINASSVNTIRISTVIDGNGNAEIFSAAIFAGGPGAETSNLHAGAVAYPVDLKSGRVYAWGINRKGEHVLEHPGSGLFMPGFQVPMWPEITDMVERAALKNPKARLVGWDVAITPTRPILFEANFGMGNEAYQWWDKGGKWRYLKSKR